MDFDAALIVVALLLFVAVWWRSRNQDEGGTERYGGPGKPRPAYPLRAGPLVPPPRGRVLGPLPVETCRENARPPPADLEEALERAYGEGAGNARAADLEKIELGFSSVDLVRPPSSAPGLGLGQSRTASGALRGVQRTA